MDQKINFIFLSKTYPIELSIFNKHSKYFLNENEICEYETNINLLNDFDIYEIHTEESVTEFLKYCQDQPHELRVNNVISIQALSTKYNVELLQKDANLFIEKHYNEIIEHFLSTKKAITPIHEALISTHLIEYSQDTRLFELPISSLYRIQQLFLYNIKKEENPNTDQITIQNRSIIDFLIKTVITLEYNSFIFISGNEFNQEQIEYLDEQILNIEDENAIIILTQFLQSNSSYIIASKKHEKLLKEQETKKYEKVIETLIKEQEQAKLEYENAIKRINGEIQLLSYNYDVLQQTNNHNAPMP